MDQTEKAAEAVAIVAHDLLNPTQCIQGWAHRLMDGETYPSDVREAGRRVLFCSQVVERLADDLVQSLQLDRGQFTLARGRVCARRVVNDLAKDMVELCASRGVALVVRQGSQTLPVQGDAIRLRQLLDNLLGNALKHVAPGRGRVELAVSRVGSSACIQVQDNGSGIDPAEQPRIFERFYRGAGQTSGVGLGLYIARAIVEAHGGSISVRSEGRGRGTTFRILLPLAEAAARSSRAVAEAPIAEAATAPETPRPVTRSTRLGWAFSLLARALA